MMMQAERTYTIRAETAVDFPAIHDLIRDAFLTAQVSNGREQDFAAELRAGGNYLPELALVAEEAGAPVGHLMLTRTGIALGDGRREEALFGGPISVRLDRRRMGIGSALIRESFHRARQLGFRSVLLVGNPDYYRRFGFRSCAEFGLKWQHPIPAENCLACELVPGALQGIRGTVECF